MEASEECVICKQPTGTLPKAEKGIITFCSPWQKEYHKLDQIAKVLRPK